MIPGIVAGQMVQGGGPWTPLNMAIVPQIYLDAQDSTVTDNGGASMISNLGALGVLGDFSQAAAPSARPAILDAELNGNRVLRFDGTNDYLSCATGAALNVFKNSAAAWAFIVYKKRTVDGSAASRAIFQAATNVSGQSRFSARASTSSGTANCPAMLGRRLDGDALVALTSTPAVVNNYALVMHRAVFSTRAGEIRVNGAVYASNSTLFASAGSTSGSSSAEVVLGAATPGASFADMDLAAIVIGNTNPSDSDILKLEGWAAHKYGLTANLPGGHPYKTVAPTT